MRTLSIDANANEAFAFVAEIRNWSKFGFHGIREVICDGNYANFRSSCGGGHLVKQLNSHALQLDYEIFFDHEDRYDVSIAISAISEIRSELTMQVVKPKRMPLDYFERKLHFLNESLTRLKQILENRIRP